MSLTDSRFSSGEVRKTFSTCSFQLLATMQATGAERQGRSVTAGSSSALPFGRRARVKATSLALESEASRSPRRTPGPWGWRRGSQLRCSGSPKSPAHALCGPCPRRSGSRPRAGSRRVASYRIIFMLISHPPPPRPTCSRPPSPLRSSCFRPRSGVRKCVSRATETPCSIASATSGRPREWRNIIAAERIVA